MAPTEEVVDFLTFFFSSFLFFTLPGNSSLGAVLLTQTVGPNPTQHGSQYTQ